MKYKLYLRLQLHLDDEFATADLSRDGGAVEIDNLLGDGKTKSAAACLGARGVRAVEALEALAHIAVGGVYHVVFDGEHQVLALCR